MSFISDTLKKRPTSIVLSEQNKKHCGSIKKNEASPSLNVQMTIDQSDDPFLDNDDEIYANLDLDYDETRIAHLTNSFRSSNPLYEEDFEFDEVLLRQVEEQENLLMNQLNSVSNIVPQYQEKQKDDKWAHQIEELEKQKEALQSENKKLQDELLTKSGEISNIRKTINKFQSENAKLRHDFSHKALEVEQSRQLIQMEQEKLKEQFKTEIQFKELELKNLKSLKSLNTNRTSNTPSTFPSIHSFNGTIAKKIKKNQETLDIGIMTDVIESQNEGKESKKEVIPFPTRSIDLMACLVGEYGSFWISEMQYLKDPQEQLMLHSWLQKISIYNSLDNTLVDLSLKLVDVYKRESKYEPMSIIFYILSLLYALNKKTLVLDTVKLYSYMHWLLSLKHIQQDNWQKALSIYFKLLLQFLSVEKSVEIVPLLLNEAEVILNTKPAFHFSFLYIQLLNIHLCNETIQFYDLNLIEKLTHILLYDETCSSCMHFLFHYVHLDHSHFLLSHPNSMYNIVIFIQVQLDIILSNKKDKSTLDESGDKCDLHKKLHSGLKLLYAIFTESGTSLTSENLYNLQSLFICTMTRIYLDQKFDKEILELAKDLLTFILSESTLLETLSGLGIE